MIQMQTRRNDIRRLKATVIAIFVMLLLLPYNGRMAVSEHSAWWTHWVYMLAHGNILHLAVNAWVLLMMHKAMKAYRVVTAWIVSVAISYLYYPELPVVGASTVIMFITGYYIPLMAYKSGWGSVAMIALCISIGFFVPQLAGMYHLLCCLAGLVFFFIDRIVQSCWDFCTND